MGEIEAPTKTPAPLPFLHLHRMKEAGERLGGIGDWLNRLYFGERDLVMRSGRLLAWDGRVMGIAGACTHRNRMIGRFRAGVN